MMKTKNAKTIFSAVFAVVMALCLVVGVNLFKTDVKADGETATTTAWQTNRTVKLVELGGSGLQYSGQSATIMNTTNLVDVPGRTVTFQFMSSGQDGWAAFMFLNGQTNWSQANWPGIGRDCDTLPHIIVQNGAAQVYGNTTSSIYGAAAVGVKGMIDSISNQLHTVEIHLGTGADGDLSYIKIDGSLLYQDGTEDTTILPWLTLDKFTENGCYVAFTCNQVGGEGGVTLLGEYNTPYVAYSTISETLNDKIKAYKGELTADATFTVKNVTGTAKLMVNGNEVTDTKAYEIADVEGGKQVTLKPSFWKTYFEQMSRNTVITLAAENGKASVYTTVLKETPLEWIGDTHFELSEIADVTYTFMSSNADTLNILVAKAGVKKAEETLTVNEDYTVEQDEHNDKNYTLTIKKEYLEKKIGDYRGLTISVTVGEDTLEGSIYCKYDTEGWVARPVDLVKDTELVTEGHYVSANLRAFSETTLSSRIYYNKSFDVTKPITLEVEAFGDGTEWALLGVMDSLKYMDYFSDGTAKDLALTVLFFGDGRKDIQKLGGFKLADNESTNADYNHLPNIKNLVIEIYFGVNSADEGYFKVNGDKIATPQKLQSDFANGKAYIGFFFNHKVTNFDFKANKDVNGIAVTGPVSANDESLYTVDISDPQADLNLNVINTDGTNIKVSCNGVESTADDIAYADGVLSVKKSFFKKLSFAKSGTLLIEDTTTGKGTEIYLTFKSSKMENAHVVFETKGSIKDAEFKLDGYTDVQSVMKNEIELATTEWYFTNGTLTIKKDNIADANGETEFIAVSDGKLIPLYVYVGEFADGYVKSGAGTTEKGNGAYLMTSANDVTFENVYDFNKGFAMKVDFKSTCGYYKSGLNYKNNGYIQFKFYDPYSKITLTYIVYTNFGENVTANDTALYEMFYMTNAKGEKVVLDMGRTVNIEKSENPAALGAHVIKFGVKDGNINIQIDNARALTVTDSIGTFNLGASILTVSTPVSVDGGEMKVAIKEYGYDDTIDYKSISLTGEEPTEPDKPGESSGSDKPSTSDDDNKSGCNGCGGNIGAGLIILPILAAGLFLYRRKENK